MKGLVGYMVIGLIMVWVIDSEGARPFATDDAGTVDAAGYELELGYDFGQEEGAFGLGFKHGLTQKMDIGMGFGYTLISEPKNRFTCSKLCLKYAIIPDLFSASITNELGTPGYDINTILTRTFGVVEIGGNLGYSVTGDTTAGAMFYALAVIVGLDRLAWEKIDFGIEASGDKHRLQNWLVGGRYKLREGFNLDIGVSSGFKRDNIIITAGLHYEF